MKNYITICLLAFICAFSISTLSAQDKKETKKVIIVEKTIDADGNVKESRIVKEGEDAEAYIKSHGTEGDSKWRTKEDVEVDVQKTKHQEMKIVIKDDDGNEKTIEWNGEGEMPEEMKNLMKEHNVHLDGDHDEEHKVVVIKQDGSNTFDFELEDGELTDEMKEMLKKHGVDIELLKDEDGNIEVFVETDEKEKNHNKAQLGVFVENNTNGAKITDFMEGSPAQNAGLESNDVITHVNKDRVRTIEDLVNALSSFKPNDIITIGYIRGDVSDSKEITLQERKELFKHKSWDEVIENEDSDHKVIKKKKIIIKENK